MKLFASIPTVLTAGGASAFGVINNTDANSLPAQHVVLGLEISDKNIEEIANISKLKKQQEIEDIKTETLDTITTAKSTSFLTTHSSNISVNKFLPELEIDVVANKLSKKQAELGGLLKQKIELDSKNTTYTNIQAHIKSTPVQKTSWKISPDSSGDCKTIESTGTPASSSTSPPCYDWHIMFIDVDNKIKAILSDQTNLISGI